MGFHCFRVFPWILWLKIKILALSLICQHPSLSRWKSTSVFRVTHLASIIELPKQAPFSSDASFPMFFSSNFVTIPIHNQC